MPSLTIEDREQLLGQTGKDCISCGKKESKNYCRECDEFFYECGCPRSAQDPKNHVGHRTY